MADAATEFLALARALTEAGETGLKREMYKAISDAAQPLADVLKNAEYLHPYMPDRYADVLAADMDVRVYKRAGANPHINVTAESYRPRNRKVIQVNAGLLRHPVFARGPRADWTWRSQEGKGMKPGFFDDAVAKAGDQVREGMAAAMDETSRQIMRG